MSLHKKKLKPHAVTCIKNAIAACIASGPNVGLAYSVDCNREDCWNPTELISDYHCTVNIREDGYTLGSSIERTLKDGTVVCGKRARLNIQVEVYSNGCQATIDTAFSVIADVAATLNSCDAPRQIFAKRIIEQSTNRVTESDFNETKTRLVQLFQVDFDYIPCRPTLVFRTY